MDGRESRGPVEPEVVKSLGKAIGLKIDDERLPAVQEVLTELIRLSATLDPIDVEGVALDVGDPRIGWEG